MPSRAARILLWLFVINLGIAFGAGLYESRIVIPDWIDPSLAEPSWNPGAAALDDTGRRFWVAVTTLPLTVLTLANLFVAWRASGILRRWWLGAAGTALVERIFTLSYFVPTMIRLMQREDSPESVATAIKWVSLNDLRHLLVLAAWLAALKTFSLLYAGTGGSRPDRSVES